MANAAGFSLKISISTSLLCLLIFLFPSNQNPSPPSTHRSTHRKNTAINSKLLLFRDSPQTPSQRPWSRKPMDSITKNTFTGNTGRQLCLYAFVPVQAGPRRQHDHRTPRRELRNVANSHLGVSQTPVCHCQGLRVTEDGPAGTGLPRAALGRRSSPRITTTGSCSPPTTRLLSPLGRTRQVFVLWKVTATIAIFSQPLTRRSLFPTVEGMGLPSRTRKGTCLALRSTPRG